VLTEFNPQVKTLDLGKSEEASWKSSKDGLEIHGVLVYPAGYVPGQEYKTVLHIHGGPIENWFNGWNGSWYNPAQYYASHGFLVLLPMIRGSSGSGPEFENLTHKNWGDADLQDALDGVDTLVARGIADPDRLVMGGWSYGGYTTAWAITHTHRFKAAMVGAGISDLFTMGITTDIAPSYLDGYFGPVIPNRRLYDAHSAISYLDQVTTPTLILHGESDLRVPVSQSYELFSGLRFMGKDVQMVTYPREPHIFTEREHQIDSLTRMLNWYESHLPAPTPR
jgi:dipeptidyl aminopeptidase/acylaminoacyl peptidase